MATTETTKPDNVDPLKKRQPRPHIAALGKRLAAEDRETLDLLEAYDRGEPDAVRMLGERTK